MNWFEPKAERERKRLEALDQERRARERLERASPEAEARKLAFAEKLAAIDVQREATRKAELEAAQHHSPTRAREFMEKRLGKRLGVTLRNALDHGIRTEPYPFTSDGYAGVTISEVKAYNRKRGRIKTGVSPQQPPDLWSARVAAAAARRRAAQ